MPSPSIVSFGVTYTAREKDCVELTQWHACSLVVLQFNHCMCQGHTGCTAGGDGLLSWRVQHEGTGTRGQDAYLQVCEEETLEQEKKQGKVRIEEGKAGKNKLWMRKVQPTKLRPSQQFFVYLFWVSGWKCAVF